MSQWLNRNTSKDSKVLIMNISRFLNSHFFTKYKFLKWEQLLSCLENEDLSNASGQGNYTAIELSTVEYSRVIEVPLADLNKV